MTQLQKAKQVIKQLKRNNYQAYFVGGVVRDFIMRKPFEDIDITTSAKPFHVMKLFDTRPTGLKYGTVTVLFEGDTFEVTTFRQDGPSQDFRHPDSVIYSDKVADDVARRDFTINGLLMSETHEITDLVGGLKDIESRIIRTIGNPYDRFNEDALRILRALYFQSKLDFSIDPDTKTAMADLKHLIPLIAAERVYAEIVKMIKSKHLKRSLQSMIDTGIDEVLPGLSKGILHILTMDQMPFVDNFFSICFTLNGSVPKYWVFPNKTRHLYETASMLATKYPTSFDNEALYTYGIENCIQAHKVNYFLGKTKYFEKNIIRQYQDLPIKSELDLALNANEMLFLTGKKAGLWLGQLRKKMAQEILKGKLKNEKEALISYVKAQVN